MKWIEFADGARASVGHSGLKYFVFPVPEASRLVTSLSWGCRVGTLNELGAFQLRIDAMKRCEEFDGVLQ